MSASGLHPRAGSRNQRHGERQKGLLEVLDLVAETWGRPATSVQRCEAIGSSTLEPEPMTKLRKRVPGALLLSALPAPLPLAVLFFAPLPPASSWMASGPHFGTPVGPPFTASRLGDVDLTRFFRSATSLLN